MTSNKIIFIVGPTAVGKSEIAVELAQKIKGEIVSCDSMQVYQEINIASNKPSILLRRKIPHHLIDIVSVEEDFDVAAFSRLARAAITEIHSRGRIPIIVGGSGLYMSILLDGIFEEGQRDLSLRHKLEEEAREAGTAVLYKRLLKVDPAAAEKIHSNDQKRIIRALEVYEREKTPISRLQKKRQGLWGKYDITIFALNRDRAELYHAIDERVDSMFKEGLIEEVKNLINKKWSKTASQIIGVKEVLSFLKGECDLERTSYLIKLHTRHYAKRQLTWFRRDKRLTWLMIGSKETPRQIALRMMKELRHIKEGV